MDSSQSDVKARLIERGRRAVEVGTDWLSLSEVAALASVPHEVVRQWLDERRLFSINPAAPKVPVYALDDRQQPHLVVCEVMQALAGYSGDALASWFESPSNYLGGNRPREVLSISPDLVVAAARNKIETLETLG